MNFQFQAVPSFDRRKSLADLRPTVNMNKKGSILQTKELGWWETFEELIFCYFQGVTPMSTAGDCVVTISSRISFQEF